MYSLRARLGFLVAALLVIAVVLQILAISSASGSMSSGDGLVQPSYLVPTLLQTLATFCVGSAIVLVAGIVASLVVDEAFLRKLEIDADAEGDGRDDEPRDDTDDSDEPSAYGSDPERL